MRVLSIVPVDVFGCEFSDGTLYAPLILREGDRMELSMEAGTFIVMSCNGKKFLQVGDRLKLHCNITELP
jgi:hypothetical protein